MFDLNPNLCKVNLNHCKSNRTGFTLLEVFLTLAMAVVLMGLIGSAIQFYARDMNVNNMDVRQTVLAGAIMQMIEDDLRLTIHPESADLAALEELMSATLGDGAQAAADTGLSDSGLSAAGIAPLEDDTEEVTEEVTDVTVLQTPGLIGNQYQIQIDISRLPRLEEYAAMFDENAGNIDDIPSEIKTVSYFVQPAGTVTGVSDPLEEVGGSANADEPLGGLVRRSLDRFAATYAALNGSQSQIDQTGEILAPEVIGIEFQYFDGINWQLEWSSDQLEELPLAVRVDLTMANAISIARGDDVDSEDAVRTFTHVIRLPMARPIEDEAEETAGTTGSASTSETDAAP